MKQLLLFLALCAAAFAGELFLQVGDRHDIPLADGRIVSAAKITAIDTDYIIAINRDGVHTLRFEALPVEWQKAGGWSAEAQSARAQALKAEAESLRAAAAKAEAEKKREEEEKKSLVSMQARIVQVLPEGLLIEAARPVVYMPQISASSSASYGGGGSVNVFGGYTPPPVQTRPQAFVGLALLVGYPQARSKADGDALDVDAVDVGFFKYTDVMGAERTVRKMLFKKEP